MPTTVDRLFAVSDQVVGEVRDAMNKHGAMSSAHEAYAVILEEVDELWDEVKKKRSQRSNVKMRDELRQIAAMAIRTIVDLNLDVAKYEV